MRIFLLLLCSFLAHISGYAIGVEQAATAHLHDPSASIENSFIMWILAFGLFCAWPWLTKDTK
jgi:hypothetical protein